nr:hypothetical protein CFP56_18404 [Quercus suber]
MTIDRDEAAALQDETESTDEDGAMKQDVLVGVPAEEHLEESDPFGLDAMLSTVVKKGFIKGKKDATTKINAEVEENKRFIKSQREALITCLEIAARRYKTPWCQTVIDILVKHAIDNVARSSIDCFISFQPSNSICKVFDEDNLSVRESSNDRPMRKKEAIRSREKNFQSIRSVEENYLHSCFAHTGEFCRLYSVLLVEAIGLARFRARGLHMKLLIAPMVLRLLVGVAGFVGQNRRLGSSARNPGAWVRLFFVLHSPGFVLLRSVLLGSSSFFFVRCCWVLLRSSSFAWVLRSSLVTDGDFGQTSFFITQKA